MFTVHDIFLMDLELMYHHTLQMTLPNSASMEAFILLLQFKIGGPM